MCSLRGHSSPPALCSGDRNVPTGAVRVRHRSSGRWDAWGRGGRAGPCCCAEDVPWGAHGTGAAGVTATARVHGSRATSAWLVAFGEQSPAEQGRGGQPARPRSPAEPATGWAGSGATPPAPPGWSCCQAWVLRSLCHVGARLLPAPAALGVLVPAQAGWGGPPGPSLVAWIAFPSARDGLGRDAGRCVGLGCAQHHHELPPAAQRCRQRRARPGEAAQRFALAWGAAAEPACPAWLKVPGEPVPAARFLSPGTGQATEGACWETLDRAIRFLIISQ